MILFKIPAYRTAPLPGIVECLIIGHLNIRVIDCEDLQFRLLGKNVIS